MDGTRGPDGIMRLGLWLAVAALAGLVSGPSRRGDLPLPEQIGVEAATPGAGTAVEATSEEGTLDHKSGSLAFAATAESDRAASTSAPLAQPADRESSLPLRELCGRIGAKLASVSMEDCLALGLVTTGGKSRDGSPIMIRDFEPSRAPHTAPRVLVIGGIHGDEYSAVSIVFKWLRLLTDEHENAFHWRVVPLLNPDGLLRERAQRMNARGVDLNRNFPNPEGHDQALDYWVRRADSNPRRYPGPAALSEPESKWLADEIQTFRPHAIVAVHAPLEVIDYDGPLEPPARLGSLMLHRMGTYPGSLGRYAGEHMALPVVTIELPLAGVLPSAAEQAEIWKDLVNYLLDNIPGARPVGRTTAVGDATDHDPGS